MKIEMGLSGKGNGGDVEINNVFDRIKSKVDNGDIHYKPTNEYYGRFNALAQDEQSAVMDAVRKTGSKEDGNNLFLKNNGNTIEVYKMTDGSAIANPETLVTTLSKTGTNLKTQPSVKEKREVIKQGNQSNTQHPTLKNIPKGGF
jgi:hypothetical protein